MDMFFAFFMVAAVIVLAFALTFFANKRYIESMKRLAIDLGYLFTQGPSPFPGARGADAPDINASSAYAAPSSAPEEPTFMKRVGLLLAPWRIKGHDADEEVLIYTVTRGSGKSRTTYTVTEMSLHPKVGGFALSKEGFFSKVGKTLFGLQDIQLGDEEFDRKVMVKGKDPEAVKLALSSETLRRSIIDAFDAYPGMSITDAKIVYERQGSLTKVDYFRPLIAAMGEIAKAIRQ
jgi:hypothetical protein